MPIKLCVEIAKSSRGKCSLASCGRVITKNHVKIGFSSTAGPTEYQVVNGLNYTKYRHLCCVSARQISSLSLSAADIANWVD